MDPQIVFESGSPSECSERSLVLHSLGIPYEILQDGTRCLLVVPGELAEKAKYELWQYETENRRPGRRARRIEPVYQESAWGVAGYIAVISIVAVMAGETAFGMDWFAAGRIDGEAIRDGEWWRTVTALTLHSGLPHFIGNVGFGALFGVMAGRVLGPGVTWLAVVLASSVANLANTLLLDSAHRAIGASTAVFAALGIVAGFSWKARIFAQDRWAYRLGPVIGGIALLAYTGTGDADTDIGAHLAGFAGGFGSGIALILVYAHVPERRVQQACGAAAMAVVVLAWLLALRVWASAAM